MLTLGLALASLTCFASPPDSPDSVAAATDAPTDAPIIVVTPAPAPEPPSPTVPDWGPQADVAVSQSPAPRTRPIAPPPKPYEPPPKPMMGVGLFVGSGIAFTIGLSARVGQVDSAIDSCDRWSQAGFASLTQCFDYFDSPGIDGNDLFVGAAYGSSMILTMVGAGALGQHKAWQTVHGDRKLRNPVSRYVLGAIFTGLGVASIAGHYALIYTDAQNPCSSWECNVQRRALWIAASDGGALLLNTGFGMLSWAGNYRSNLARYRKLQWSVVPNAGRGSVGATASLRF